MMLNVLCSGPEHFVEQSAEVVVPLMRSGGHLVRRRHFLGRSSHGVFMKNYIAWFYFPEMFSCEGER